MSRNKGFGVCALIGAAAAALAAGGAQATTITGWNTDNVVVGPSVDAGETGASVVYDQDVTGGVPAGAVTNGEIVYDAPEANTPGIKVVNGDPTFTQGGNTTAGCIMASSVATCDSGFQSGKRFKQVLTGSGPTDLVFDLGDGDTGGTDGYQVFQKLINKTGKAMTGFDISLGTGVGDMFGLSGTGDGLSFSTSFGFGPEKLSTYSQFPFGLFGDADTNQNFTLDGFFAPERSGFNLVSTEDMISTNGLFGPYSGLFGGGLLTGEDVPTGAFWDDDDNPDTDDVLMAWLNPDGKWELRREIVADGPDEDGIPDVAALDTALTFDTLAEVEAHLTDLGLGEIALGEDVIEDLANVNVNYAINVDGFTGENFTLRLDATVVPLPATLPMLISVFGLGGLAAWRRRRAAA